MQITAGKLEHILKEQGIDEKDRQEIIEQIAGKELDDVIDEVKEEKKQKNEDQEKDQQSTNLARKLGYKS